MSSLRPALRAKMSSTQLVELALSNHGYFKLVVSDLERRDPCPSAVDTLASAHESGAGPSWLVAAVLGGNRHPNGIPLLLQILSEPNRQLSHSYAAESLMRTDPSQGEKELLPALQDKSRRHLWRSVSPSLVRLGSRMARQRVVELGLSGGLNPLAVAAWLHPWNHERPRLAELLHAQEERAIRLATEVLYLEAIEARNAGTELRWNEELAQSLGEAMDDGSIKMSPKKRRVLNRALEGRSGA